MTENLKEGAMSADPNSVPLPNEVPPPPDLTSLPTHILHSGTVETLIGLNEDLLARLKINIRRNSLLEQQIMEHEHALVNLNGTNSSLQSQLQVFQEKDRIVREKLEREEKLHGAARARLTMLKDQMAKLEPAQRFQRRVRLWVKPLINRLKMQLEEEKKSRASRDTQIADLRRRLSEAVKFAENIEKDATKDQLRLVEQYEAQKKSLEEQLEALKSLRDKAARFDESVAEKTELANRNIFLERRATEIEKNLGAEIRELQTQTVRYRQEAKTLAIESMNKDQEIKSLQMKLQELKEERNRTQDQFESLQAVWADAQKRHENTKAQLESLNKLNQELSRKMKEERKSDSSAIASGTNQIQSVERSGNC